MFEVRRGVACAEYVTSPLLVIVQRLYNDDVRRQVKGGWFAQMIPGNDLVVKIALVERI